jgi:glycosyltransferase involved in cell wall biosynthesis
MRIVFDAYELVLGQGKSIGIYNYAKNLLKAMPQALDDGAEIVVLCNSLNYADFKCEHPAVSYVTISKLPDKFARLAWFFGQAAVTVKKLAADVYFSPKGFLPIGMRLVSPQIKTVIVIHDLIPLWYADHYPGYFGRFEELFINNAISSSIKRANHVIAISGATADDITARFGTGVPLSMAHNGVSIHAPGPRPYDKPYIFAMASQLPHKNAAGVLAAYRAYRTLAADPLPLFFCGIAAADQEGVTAVKSLFDEQLHAYYAYADLFLFLSLIEGFGFPPVEALAHGTPVLCSDIPALREVAKDLAAYADPRNPEQAGAKIAELLAAENSPARREARKKISQEFTWLSCAISILNTIKSL